MTPADQEEIKRIVGEIRIELDCIARNMRESFAGALEYKEANAYASLVAVYAFVSELEEEAHQLPTPPRVDAAAE